MNLKYFFRTGFLLLSLSLLVSCSEDDDDLSPDPEPGAETYETDVYLTDSPIDNAEVEGVFVTIAEVWINGEAIEDFEKTSIDVSSLHSGNTELLGSLELESGTTSEITLVLDSETDAAGESPGHYVLTADGEKRALTTASGEIDLNDEVEIHENDDNEIVLDFDLRKAVVTDESGEYQFVSDSKLASSIRAVNALETGTITGTVTDFGSSDSETMVVYAYKAGAYGEAETQTDEDGTRFGNAVNSSLVSEDSGDFELHFMQEGDYELHFVSYSDNDADGQLEFEGELEANSATDSELDLQNLTLGSNTEVDVDVVIIGLLNL